MRVRGFGISCYFIKIVPELEDRADPVLLLSPPALDHYFSKFTPPFVSCSAIAVREYQSSTCFTFPYIKLRNDVRTIPNSVYVVVDVETTFECSILGMDRKRA